MVSQLNYTRWALRSHPFSFTVQYVLYGFYYLPQEDAFCCPEGAKLVYQRLNCSQTTGKYLRCYQVQGDTCRHCKQNATCFKQTGVRRRILGSGCYPAFYRGHERIGSDTYWHMMRLRKIWAEGSFSVLKREHCLSKIRKRGIPAVTEECLLSAMALNLKRMVRAILLTSHMLKIGAESLHFLLRFLFCQQVQLLTVPEKLALHKWRPFLLFFLHLLQEATLLRSKWLL